MELLTGELFLHQLRGYVQVGAHDQRQEILYEQGGDIRICQRISDIFREETVSPIPKCGESKANHNEP